MTKSYAHDLKHITLKTNESRIEKTDSSISFYTNNLNHLKNIEGIKRVYLEISPEIDTPDINNDENYNLNYMINFLKEAIEISHTKDYELIWKWPDITHDKLIKALNKVKGILNKMHYNIPIMSNNFKGDYGPYSMNITNTETIDSLENYRILTISPELTKKDYKNIIKYCKNPNKLELIVQGSIELMKTRYSLLYGKEFKQAKNSSEFYLIDKNNNKYPIHKSISSQELILFNFEDISLLPQINHLKEIGYSNFAIDARFRDDKYCEIVNVYKKALKGKLDKNSLLKYSTKNTLGNY